MKIFCFFIFVVFCYSVTARPGKPGPSKPGSGCNFQDGSCAAQLGQGIVNIIEGLRQGNALKSQFTTNFVKQARQQYPDWSVVVAHKSKVTGTSVHQHHEVKLEFGTYGYDIFFCRPGTRFDLWLIGDGGPINWEYAGAFKRDGKHIWVE